MYLVLPMLFITFLVVRCTAFAVYFAVPRSFIKLAAATCTAFVLNFAVLRLVLVPAVSYLALVRARCTVNVNFLVQMAAAGSTSSSRL